ncbi:hypothetical protein C8R43DRAFT_1031254 [Mycena crocata]|nr:hypothetical protein C8R43DRAFT_1031254 [Mycena crocata]
MLTLCEFFFHSSNFDPMLSISVLRIAWRDPSFFLPPMSRHGHRSPPPPYGQPPQPSNNSATVDLSSSSPSLFGASSFHHCFLTHVLTSLLSGRRVTTGNQSPSPSMPLYSFDPDSHTHHSFDIPVPSHSYSPSPPPSPTHDHIPLPRMQTVFPAVLFAPKATRAKRSQPVHVAESQNAQAPESDDVVDFEMVIHCAVPPKKPAGRAKSRAKVDPIPFGPMVVNTQMNWLGFLGVLARAMGTQVAFLDIGSFMWRWLKPANSPSLPIRDEAGFKSLIRQILSPPKNIPQMYIIIKMDPPAKPPPGSMPGSSRIDAVFDAAFGADNDSDEDDQPKKLGFDDGLQELMDQISDKYPAGTCSVHPEIECFHHRPTNLHYELTRTKKIVWAAAIRNNAATLTTIPSGSQHFNIKSALKSKKPTPNIPIRAPEAGIPQTPAPPQPFTPQFPYYASPFGYPSTPHMGYPPAFPGYPPPHDFYQRGGPMSQMSPWEHTPRRRRERSWDGSSPPRKRHNPDPPSSPGVSGGSVDDFCTQYPDLPAETRGFLLDMGFLIGDDISIVTEAHWTAAGLTLFGWNRVLKAYARYKRSLRSQ